MAYIFYFFNLSQGIDDAQSFLGYVSLAKFSFCILFSSASCAHLSQEGLCWTEGSCSGEASLPGFPIKCQTCQYMKVSQRLR